MAPFGGSGGEEVDFRHWYNNGTELIIRVFGDSCDRESGYKETFEKTKDITINSISQDSGFISRLRFVQGGIVEKDSSPDHSVTWVYALTCSSDQPPILMCGACRCVQSVLNIPMLEESWRMNYPTINRFHLH